MANQRIPLVDLKAQYRTIQADIDAAIQGVLADAAFIMGPAVGTFEEAFADLCGSDHCIGVSSGTSALMLALQALGVRAGGEVITAAHTFIATAEAISALGAKPVFVDIDPRTYNINPNALVDAITPATQAIVPVHIYGQPADMATINEVAAANDLPVIEDAAQAHGATLNGKVAGTLGDAACFSFYPGKNLGAYGDAGAITTNRADLAERVGLLRNHGRRTKYVHDTIGYGERLDTLQAAILHVKLGYLPTWTEARRRLAARYGERLSDCELVLPYVSPGANPAWHLYVVRTPQRDALLDHLRSEGIGAGIHYPLPLHLQPAYAHLGYQRGTLPVTEIVADTCLSLPLYPEMTDEQQDIVIDAVRAFLDEDQSL